MAVMPHTDVSRALEMALTLDVPFWPQLPNYSYCEDMYVQAAEYIPGILLDLDKRTLRFSMDKFTEELEATLLQVLSNPYPNAWQALPDGGDLRISTENVNFDQNSYYA